MAVFHNEMNGIYASLDSEHHALVRDGDALRSADGSVSYPVKDDVPQFSKCARAISSELTEQLRHLNEVCLKDGWEAALRNVYGRDSNSYRYAVDSHRAKFLDLLPLNDQAVVFELGSGLGPFTASIAQRARYLYALEIVPQQARFVLERCRQSGANNVAIACGGDGCQLPYLDESIDLAIINLVFEWCAESENQPEVGQRRLLGEIFRVLKRGGALYLNTKNRFSLRHITDNTAGGEAHDHQGGRLRKLILALGGKDRHMGTIHSHNHLTAMLKESGFGNVRSYWAAPEMRYPTQFVPTDAASIRAARRRGDLVQGDNKATRLLMPLIPECWVKHLTAGLTFMAIKV